MSHRITNQTSDYHESGGDQRLLDQLMLYKTPGIIRDTKQVFLYVSVNANTTITNPLTISYPNATFTIEADPGGAPQKLDEMPPYFAPIGTRRSFNIGEQVNSLLDLRVPKDKYFVEIQLLEAQLETDPSNYELQPNLEAVPKVEPQIGGGFRVLPNEYEIARTYEVTYPNPPVPNTDADTAPQVVTIRKPYLLEARKKSIPQPLFVRIPEMDNGEPYNWTVTNNGGVNDDKSHNVLIRHGDVDYQKLTLEYGHLVFEGQDEDYQKLGESIDPSSSFWESSLNTKVKNKLANYNRFKYLDYNQDWPNAFSDPGNPNFDPQFVAPVHRGRSIIMTNSEIQPDFTDAGNHRVATVPLKTNQQCSNILFRFAIKLIHLF